MGFGDFSNRPGETDMILPNANNGGVEVYDISNNQIMSGDLIVLLQAVKSCYVRLQVQARYSVPDP
jgi:hypothetical protein